MGEEREPGVVKRPGSDHDHEIFHAFWTEVQAMAVSRYSLEKA